MKKRTTALLALLLCIPLSSLPSCAQDTNFSADYELRIALLESCLASLQESRAQLESKHSEEISSIKASLEGLSEKLSETTKADTPLPESEYFGFSYKKEGDKVTITAYAGDTLDVVIPSTIGGLPVTEIADSAFENSGIRSVSIPETVESIGWFAFRGCSSLSRAVLPANVSTIGYDAFSSCPRLTVYAPSVSYAYKYAKSYGISVSAE